MQHLMAAKGWLDLGNHLEANAELEAITAAESGANPDVLEVQFRIYGLAGRFGEAERVLKGLLILKPESRIQGFFDLATYARDHHRIEDARRFLAESLANVPDVFRGKALDGRHFKAWVDRRQPPPWLP